jgi:hypothetical protein
MKQIAGNAIFFIAATVFLFESLNCNQAISEIRMKNVGPLTLAGIEYRMDYKRVTFKIDSLKNILDSLKINTKTAFGVFRDSIDANTEKGRCMLGFVLESTDFSKINQIRKKGFFVQEMGCTNSLYMESTTTGFTSFKSVGKKVQEKLKSYAVKNKFEIQPILCIFSDDNLQFSMEIMNLGSYKIESPEIKK